MKLETGLRSQVGLGSLTGKAKKFHHFCRQFFNPPDDGSFSKESCGSDKTSRAWLDAILESWRTSTGGRCIFVFIS